MKFKPAGQKLSMIKKNKYSNWGLLQTPQKRLSWGILEKPERHSK